MAPAPPPIGYVNMISDDPRAQVWAELGPMKPRVVSAYGGWQVTARPRRVGLTDWQGREPIKVQYQVLFNNFKARIGTPIENAIRDLSKMAGLGIDDDEPPLLFVDARGGIPHDNTRAPNRRWVIETLEWDEEYEERNQYGHRIRALATITIMEYVEDVRLQRLSAAHKRRKKKKRSKKKGKGRLTSSWVQIHVARQGDNLLKISALYLGGQGRWREIAKLNKIRDPRRSLKPGTVIKLP